MLLDAHRDEAQPLLAREQTPEDEREARLEIARQLARHLTHAPWTSQGRVVDVPVDVSTRRRWRGACVSTTRTYEPGA